MSYTLSLPRERFHPARFIVLTLLSVVAFLVLAVVFATGAGAETIETSPTVIDVPPGAILAISPALLSALGGTLLPILNGIILKTNASSGAGALVNMVTTALFTVVTFLLTEPSFDVATVVTLFLTTFITSAAAYRGLWKPLNAGGRGAPLSDKVPGFIGPSGSDPLDPAHVQVPAEPRPAI